MSTKSSIKKDSSNNWWKWINKNWVAATDPFVSSANGAKITGSGKLIDSTGNIWTMPGGVAYINGLPAGTSSLVVQLDYINQSIYYKNKASNWWIWQDNGWQNRFWVATSNPTGTSQSCIDPNGTSHASGST